MKYLYFLFYCFRTNFKFFFECTEVKAHLLATNKLFFWAGILYMEIKNYAQAMTCFEKTHAYSHLILVYQKLGLYSKAIELADQKKYYKKGAALCEKINNPKKAAYFYAYFKPLYAAKLYKNEKHFYEAGQCYLSAHQLLSALECFKKCEDPQKKQDGLKQLEEFGTVLYLSKYYEEALNLFIKLKDYYSALECAKQLRIKVLVDKIYILISHAEAENQNYILAAKSIEPYDKNKALHYYYLAQSKSEALRLLLDLEHYEKAFNLCLYHNDLHSAYQLATAFDIPITYST